MTNTTELKRVLGPIHLWAIAVGLVISGDYFGWNYGVAVGGPLGMIAATLIITVLYVCFIFSYTELSTAIPHSGGPYAYARRAFGPFVGYMAGMATVIELVFAPPAIARAIGAYVHFRVPELPVNAVAIAAFALFCAINALGVGIAATFELVITAVAAFELLLFFLLTGPSVDVERIIDAGLPFGARGIFDAIPFAIWFYLAIEGVAMSAEEVKRPSRDIPIGYVTGILTLVTLALGTLVCTTGVVPWQQLTEDDSPLPKALAAVLSPSHPMTHLMVYLGLFGLIASLHGIIMGYSRQVFALARDNLLPSFLARVHPRFGTPMSAIAVPGVIGCIAVLTERTDAIITLSVLGAVTLYVVSMLSLFKLRASEPDLARPFRAPFYPVPPAVALVLSAIAFVAVVASDTTVAMIYVAIMATAALAYYGSSPTRRIRSRSP